MCLTRSRSQSGGEEDTDSESIVISDRGGTKVRWREREREEGGREGLPPVGHSEE